MLSKADLQEQLISDLQLLRQPDGWLTAGRPHREEGRPLDPDIWADDQESTFDWLFGRDSIIAALELLPIGNGPEIAKATLSALAKTQGKNHNWKREEQPGRIPHEVRETSLLQSGDPQWEFPYYGSVDATPLFIILAFEYVQRTGDWEFVEEIWDNLVAAANWMKLWGDVDGDYFIESERLSPYGIPNQIWKDFSPFSPAEPPPNYDGLVWYSNAAIVEVQAYAYLAWVRMKVMAARLNKPWKQYVYNANALRSNFEKMFWSDEAGYALALDGDKKQITTMTSNQGHLLLSGMIPPGRRAKLVDRLRQPDMWTPHGIYTMSSEAEGFDPYRYHQGSIWFHDNWMIWWGLNRYPEFQKEADELRKNLIKTAQMLGEAPELHACVDGKLKTTDHVKGWGYKPANHVQAWAGAAVLNLLTHDMTPEQRKEIVI